MRATMHSVTDRQTDGQTDEQDDANSRPYCVAVRSAKKPKAPWFQIGSE